MRPPPSAARSGRRSWCLLTPRAPSSTWRHADGRLARRPGSPPRRALSAVAARADQAPELAARARPARRRGTWRRRWRRARRARRRDRRPCRQVVLGRRREQGAASAPATRAAAFERTPDVTSTASQTTPTKVANSLGWTVVWAGDQEAAADAGDEGGQRPANDLHLHHADARRPGSGLAPARGVERQPGRRSSEVDDEERNDHEDGQTDVGEGEVRAGEAGPVEA